MFFDSIQKAMKWKIVKHMELELYRKPVINF